MALNEEEYKQLNAWEEKHLSVITAALKDAIKETGPMPLEAFHCVASRLAQEAYNTFAKELGLNTPGKIPTQFGINLFVAIVGGFNSVLPCDHRYVIVGIYSDKSPTLRLGSAERKAVIPGAHDIIRTNIVPIIQMKNMELPDGEYEIKDFRVADVSFGDSDKDLPKV